MGLILDRSILIADERGNFDMPGFLRHTYAGQPVISAIIASELLHGVERASDAARKLRRQQHVEQELASVLVEPFDLAQARCHARIWAELESRGQMIGPHDLLIAAAAVTLGHELATTNAREFQHVSDLKVVDATPFLKR